MDAHKPRGAEEAAPSGFEAWVEMAGRVVEVLPGCGLVALSVGKGEEITLQRGTEGVSFDDIYVGQRLSCRVARRSRRVLRVEAPDRAMPAVDADDPAGSGDRRC